MAITKLVFHFPEEQQGERKPQRKTFFEVKKKMGLTTVLDTVLDTIKSWMLKVLAKGKNEHRDKFVDTTDFKTEINHQATSKTF